MSLVTGNGNCTVWDEEGRSLEIELPVDDVIRIDKWHQSSRVAHASVEASAPLQRAVFFLDEDSPRLLVPFTLDPASPDDFHVVRFAEGWRESPSEAWYGLDASIAAHAKAAAVNDRDFVLQAHDHDLTVSLRERLDRDGLPVVVVAASHAIDGHEVWRRAVSDGGPFTLVSPAPASEADWNAAGQLATSAFRHVGAHPLDVFASHLARSMDGENFDARGRPSSRAEQEVDSEGPATRSRSAHWIKALHVPWALDEAVSVVTIDRRHATAWYQYVSGGPVEATPLSLPDLPDHELYVNSRSLNLPDSSVNERATVLVEHFALVAPLRGIRGDALLVRSAGQSGYPRSVDSSLVVALAD